MNAKIPEVFKSLATPEDTFDPERIVEAIQSVPLKHWEAFFDKFQMRQLRKILSSASHEETLAIAKSTTQIKTLFAEVFN